MIAHVSRDEVPAAGRSARLGHRRRRLRRRARHAAAARRRRRTGSRTSRDCCATASSDAAEGSVDARGYCERSIPSTGETWRIFDELSDAELDAKLARAVDAFRTLPPHADRRARGRAAQRAAAILESEQEALGRADGGGDGQARQGRPRRSGEVRVGLPLLRRARGDACWPMRRSRERRGRQLRALSAARRGARGDAVELSVLAGVPLGRARADGRQRRAAEARVERAAVRAADRGHPPARRLPRRRRSRRCSSTSTRVPQAASPTRASRRCR